MIIRESDGMCCTGAVDINGLSIWENDLVAVEVRYKGKEEICSYEGVVKYYPNHTSFAIDCGAKGIHSLGLQAHLVRILG